MKDHIAQVLSAMGTSLGAYETKLKKYKAEFGVISNSSFEQRTPRETTFVALTHTVETTRQMLDQVFRSYSNLAEEDDSELYVAKLDQVLSSIRFLKQNLECMAALDHGMDDRP